VYLFPSKIQ